MTQLLSYRFRSELARDFHRNITNTQTTASFATPVGNTIFSYTATAGQTTFSGSGLTYTPGRIAVFLNGTQLDTDDYTATTGTSVVLASPAAVSDKVVVVTYNILNYPNPLDYYYVFLGKTTAWTNDASPPTPTDTRETEAQTRRDIMAVKRVQPNDSALLVENNVWASGTTYAAYDSDVVLQNLSNDFYVQHQYRIYKCVKAGASTSTNAPVHTGVVPVSYADGYHWQFLYEIPHGDRRKFMDNSASATYLPVRFVSSSSAFDHNGTVSAIEIVNAGSGYSIASPPTVTILGDGTGATATANVNPSGGISSIVVTNGGQNYSYAIVSISGGGSGATATASLLTSDVPNPLNVDVAVNGELENGSIRYVNIINGGSGYTAGNTITVAGDGTGFAATVGTVSASGAITSITISNVGAGYTYATLTPAGGANANLQVVISPQGGHGTNLPVELLSRFVGIVTSFEDVADDFFLNNNFRQFGLLKNINKYDESVLFSSDTGKATYVITVSNNSTIAVDNLMTTVAGGNFRVVSKLGTTQFTLQPIIDDASLSVNTILTGPTGSAYTPTAVTSPEIDVHSGDLIYTKNVTPITRTTGQLEKVKLFFSF